MFVHPIHIIDRFFRCLAWLLVACGTLPALAEPVGAPTGAVVPFDLPSSQAGDLIDLRFLNHRPAGRYGRLKAQGDKLIWPDGSPARFWGVNLQGNALFDTADAQIDAHAERLARLGVNLVRIHHHDSEWVSVNIFGPHGSRDDQLDMAAMERLDRWTSALKAQGIYIWLDLHVGRQLRAGRDRVDHVEELAQARNPGDLRGFNFVNASIKRDMQRVTAAYLNHINRYTGLAYKEDPGVAVVLISNENDLVTHFANRVLPNKPAPAHSANYMEQARAFARQHGFRRRQISKAWEGGPPKMFLADLEQAFFTDMISHLRGLGYGGLIATSSVWGGLDLAGVASLSLGDVIDVHSYGKNGQHFARPQHSDDIFTPMVNAHVTGKPMTISEWNMSPFPAPARGSVAVHMAALAGFQGWDAPILYGYAQGSLSRARKPGNWHAANDPSLIGVLPAAALLFRAEQIRPASQHYLYQPSARRFFDPSAVQLDQGARRALLERHGLQTVLPQVSQLPWMVPTPLARPDWQEAVPTDPQTGVLRSDTNEIERYIQTNDRGDGTIVIDSPAAQIVAGHIEGERATLSNARFEADPPDAVLAIQSLGSEPLTQARRLLVTLMSPATPDGSGQFIAPRLTGTIRFRADPRLVLTGLSPARALERVEHSFEEGWHALRFERLPATTWLSFSRP